jgi:ACS family tartrate transporter-like MFS transporter
MTSSTPAASSPSPGSVGDRALKKAVWRIVPLVVLLYLIAYIDRTNVGFVKAELSADLGLSNAAYGLGAGIFFVGYVIFEVPSNAGMYRWGARRWLSRILVSWGIMSILMAAVNSEWSFYLVRFLLGVAEAGFFPAILFYFTLWFPAAQRVMVLGLFVIAQPVANAIGSPMSGFLLGMHGVWGLTGWQWMFIIQGIPAVLFGFACLKLLTDTPEDARWLHPDERRWLVDTMRTDAALTGTATGTAKHHSFRDGMRDPRAWVYGLLNCGMACGIYGLAFWLPTLVDSLGQFSSIQRGWIVMIPYAVSVPFVYFVARYAARTGRRAAVASASMLVTVIGLLGAAYMLSVSPIAAMVMLSIAAIGIYSTIGPFLSIPSAAFIGAAAAAGLGLQNAIGNVGGFVSPFLVGLIKDATGSNTVALTVLAVIPAVTAVCLYWYANRRPEGNSAVHAKRMAAAPSPQPEST